MILVCIFVTGWKVNCNPVDIESEQRESVEQENENSTRHTPSDVRVDSEPEHTDVLNRTMTTAKKEHSVM